MKLNSLFKLNSLLLCLLLTSSCASASKSIEEVIPPIETPDSEEEDKPSDKPKLTFSNPVVNADLPDPSIVRVGDDYYMVTTTMYFTPAAPIMHSNDLVNWKIIGYIAETIDESPANNLEYDAVTQRSEIYAAGQWATSLRYHDGYFYAMFMTGFAANNYTYIYRTKNPAGQWELVRKFDKYHDSSLFFEEDGTAYIITAGGDILKLNSDLLIEGKIATIDKGTTYSHAEGCQFFKVNGYYYAFYMYWGDMRSVLCFRSNRLEGPYESKIVLHDKGVAQGGLIDTPSGEWLGYFFQDRGPVGRSPMLVPCRWIDGWPIMGAEDGTVPTVMELPLVEATQAAPEVVVSDTFDGNQLGLTWQWNHNPDPTKWSLTERVGYLRLKTTKVMEEDDLFHARNTLTQRAEGEQCIGSVSLDVSNMKDGDRAGLSAFCFYAGSLGIEKSGEKRELVMTAYEMVYDANPEEARRVEKERVFLGQDLIHLRVHFNFSTNRASFFYSLDNASWIPIGNELQMYYTLAHFTGYRFAIFNYATKQEGGYVDVDSFHYTKLE